MNEAIDFGNFLVIHTEEVLNTVGACRRYKNKVHTVEELYLIYRNSTCNFVATIAVLHVLDSGGIAATESKEVFKFSYDRSHDIHGEINDILKSRSTDKMKLTLIRVDSFYLPDISYVK